MTVRNVKKNLAAQQDLLPGVGPYQQVRRGVVVDVDGPAKSYIELWKGYCGDAYAGTFEDGFIATNNCVAVSLTNGKAYRYLATVPVIIKADSLPDANWVEFAGPSLRSEVFPLLTDTSNKVFALYEYPDVVKADIGVTIHSSSEGLPPLAYSGEVYHPPYNIFAGFTITSLSQSLWGQLLVGASTGQTYVYSRMETVESNQLVFGEEYLERFHRSVNLASGTNNPARQPVKIVLSGDSTTVGVGATSDAFKPHIQLQSIASSMGYSYINVVNKGVSGGSTYQWKDLWIPGELAENPDLLVLRWGVNDPATPSQTVETFEQSLREGLATIRSQKTVAELSILLMTPCTTDNDAGTRRVNEWHVAINRAIRRAARDYMCCFIDTHRFFADAKNSAGIWMDNVDPTSTRVHPLDILYTKIAQLMGKVIFPDGFTLARTNCVVNIPTYPGENTGVGDSSAFISGITLNRLISSDVNQPLNGMCITLKHCEGAAIQIATPYLGITSGKQISFRASYKNDAVPGSLGNGFWTGVEYAPALENGWTFPPSGFRPLRYKFGVDGELKLVGTLNPGTLTAGTRLFSIPNPYFHPGFTVVMPAIADVAGGQQACQVSVTPAGDVLYNGPTASVFRIHINGIVPL